MDGFLIVFKPAGMTSHDVVGKVRRARKQKRVGHAGTLDPDATGVLVVAVGQATRLLPHLCLEPKVYRATLGLGTATDTEDASGQVVAQADASHITDQDLDAVLGRFLGQIEQVPPMVSALHHNGQRLYELARQGITVERAPRSVTVHALELLDERQIRVTCSGGTYIRTLCKDIGAALGVPAHMARLVREAVGPYRWEEAVGLDALESTPLIPLHEALHWPTVEATEFEVSELRLGRAIPLESDRVVAGDEAEARSELAVVHQGNLLALVRLEADDSSGASTRAQPFKVFTT